MTVAVNIASRQPLPGVETVFTENVSSRGARVVSGRRWRPGDRLDFTLLPGDVRVNARVVYCHEQREREFAIGLEFLEPVARWLVGVSPDSGDNLHG